MTLCSVTVVQLAMKQWVLSAVGEHQDHCSMQNTNVGILRNYTSCSC